MVNLPESKDRFITVNNIRLHYLDWGNEELPAIIFLPGTSGTAHDWDFIASRIQGQYHCLALDQRGQGDSQWADSYEAQDFATDIALFVDTLNLGKVTLLGLSLGGINAIFYAGTHPEKVDKLIIIDVGPVVDPRILEIRPMIHSEFSSLADFMDFQRQRNPLGQEEPTYHYARHTTKKLPDGRLTYKHDQKLEETVLNTLKTGVQIDVMWQLLAQIMCPTLIMRGAGSVCLSQEVAQRMVKAMSQAELVEIEGAGHALILDKPDEFKQAVEHFLGQERRDYG